MNNIPYNTYLKIKILKSVSRPKYIDINALSISFALENSFIEDALGL